MTLKRYKFDFAENFVGFRRFGKQFTAKRMKIDVYCQRQRCNPLNVLFDIMFVAFICCTFVRWGLHTLTAVARLP